MNEDDKLEQITKTEQQEAEQQVNGSQSASDDDIFDEFEKQVGSQSAPSASSASSATSSSASQPSYMTDDQFKSESSHADEQLSDAYANEYGASDYDPTDDISKADSALSDFADNGKATHAVSQRQADDLDEFCKRAISTVAKLHSGINVSVYKLSEMAKALESQEKVIDDSKYAGHAGAVMLWAKTGVPQRLMSDMRAIDLMTHSATFQSALHQLHVDRANGKKVKLEKTDPSKLTEPEYMTSHKQLHSMADDADDIDNGVNSMSSQSESSNQNGGEQ